MILINYINDIVPQKWRTRFAHCFVNQEDFISVFHWRLQDGECRPMRLVHQPTRETENLYSAAAAVVAAWQIKGLTHINATDLPLSSLREGNKGLMPLPKIS